MEDGTISGCEGLNSVLMDSGVFNLKGGAISQNSCLGVYILDGTFNMTGGSISGNTGHGVYVAGGTFNMSSGTISDNTYSVGGGVYVESGTFTMTGGTISSNTASNGGGGVNITQGGTFRMDGGSIESNTSNASGGGVFVADGTFTMDSGNISKNHSKSSTTSGGGGVYIYSNATFNMNGGTISDNIADFSGGGVYIDNGDFTMTNGTITGNTAADDGGGVYHLGTFQVSGNANVTGNTVSGSANNVYLPLGKTATISQPLGDSALIGVTAETPSVGLAVATGAATGDAAKFQSDTEYYAVIDGTTAGQLVLTSGGSLTVFNAVEGIPDPTSTYTYTLTGPDGFEESFTITGPDSHTVNSLLPGTYHLTASPVEISGYTCTVDSGDTDVQIESGVDTILTVTHTYTAITDPPNQPGIDIPLDVEVTPTQVEVANGTVNPTVTITSSIDFGAGATDVGSYAVTPGSTGLRLASVGSVERAVDPRRVTLTFSGTAAAGTMTVTVTQAAYGARIANEPTVTITVPAPSSSGGSSSGGGGGGGGGTTPTPPAKTPEIPETVPSPVQEEIIKGGDEKHPDWIDRLELPDYARSLYNAMSGRPIESGVTNKPHQESVFQDRKSVV